jgi:hypothetical protein
MSPTVELSPNTFSRLQGLAVPLVDTIESVINRVIDAYESNAMTPAANGAGDQQIRAFNPNTPPDLTHTKILGVTFSGKDLGRGEDNWNGLLNAAVRAAKARSKSAAEFKQLMIVNFVEGEKQNEGYRPLSGTGISVQGQDANGAWRGVCHIAQALQCSVSVKFAWREKEGAAHPGVTGTLSIVGNP